MTFIPPLQFRMKSEINLEVFSEEKQTKQMKKKRQKYNKLLCERKINRVNMITSGKYIFSLLFSSHKATLRVEKNIEGYSFKKNT